MLIALYDNILDDFSLQFKQYNVYDAVNILDTDTGVIKACSAGCCVDSVQNLVRGNAGGIGFRQLGGFVCKALDIGYCPAFGRFYYKGYVHSFQYLVRGFYIGSCMLGVSVGGTIYIVKSDGSSRHATDSVKVFGCKVSYSEFVRSSIMVR